jgi:hypothetical protein
MIGLPNLENLYNIDLEFVNPNASNAFYLTVTLYLLYRKPIRILITTAFCA